jgi:cytochrome bd-type quinol oxidase subunit 1
MFTTGQLVFAIIVIVAFILLMVYSYRGDRKLHKKQYKGSLWVLLGFLVFITSLLLIKSYLKP